jgi:hypothetical protein
MKEYTLLARYPDHRKAFEKLLKCDPEFESILKDYDDCVSALSRWSASDDLKAEARVREYKELCEELENEALAYVD